MDFLINRNDLRGDEDKCKLILTQEEIQKCVQKCADVINEKFKGKEVVLTCILKGAVYFFVDLSRKLNIPYNCYFIEASSYHNKQTQSEHVELLSVIVPSKFEGKHVILIDELFDNGNTIENVKEIIHQKAFVPKEKIFTCTIFKKNKKTKFPDPDLYGILVPDIWLFGYGLDNCQEKRGWIHLFACPKEMNVPKSEDDIIFEDENKYNIMRDKLKSLLLN